MKCSFKAQTLKQAFSVLQRIPREKVDEVEILFIKRSEIVSVVLSLNENQLEKLEDCMRLIPENALMLQTLTLEKGRIYKTFPPKIVKNNKVFKLHYPEKWLITKRDLEKETKKLEKMGYVVKIITTLIFHQTNYWIYKYKKPMKKR